MTYAKPAFRHPDAKTNDVGCTRRDYEGVCLPCVLGAATTPLAPRSSTLATSFLLNLIAWPSSQASAVLPRHPHTF